ncbi:hypothetical protein Tco_1130263, partial [Tanacetum coccineum]
PTSTTISTNGWSESRTRVGQMRQFPQSNQYDPLFDSIDPSYNRVVEVEKNNKHKAVVVSEENDEFGKTACRIAENRYT